MVTPSAVSRVDCVESEFALDDPVCEASGVEVSQHPHGIRAFFDQVLEDAVEVALL